MEIEEVVMEHRRTPSLVVVFGAAIGFVAGVAAVTAAVRAWRREVERAARRDDVPHRPVLDTVLADRIRTALGPLARSLDMPHVHVTVEHGVAILHGDVPTKDAALAVEARVRGQIGVRDVRSHLHVGMIPGESGPSAAVGTPSDAARRLASAARHAGGGDETAAAAAAAVLGALGRAVTPHGRARLASHLPHDVAAWLEPTIWQPVDTVPELYAAVGEVAPVHAPWVVQRVVAELRSMLSADDDTEIALELADGLRHLWLDVETATG